MKQIKQQRIDVEGFRPYGSVARRPAGPPLAEDDTFRYWSDAAHYGIEGETEIGFCTVYRQERDEVNWMERHMRTPEVLIAADRPFLLPVMSEDGRVDAFLVETGEAAVIGQGVWHSACKPIDAEEATYFVIFRRGTPQEDVTKMDIEPVVIERA
jgi:ureidoglycolate hydrolase